MSFPNDLREQARHLANREPKRPKQASLRRAVSTAYYALFHLLSMETAKNWKRPAERSTVARMLDHGPMARVCTGKRDELNQYFNTNPPSGHDLDVLRHLHVITNAFVEMLQHRHTADYNGAIKWSRTDVLDKIQSVEAAFASWHEIRDEHEAQNFLVTLLLKERKT
jgi:uncharacterized protein (UPF0332 family)